MTETIGKITLNLDKYPGEDYYCDGSVEDEILDIVKKYSTVEYDRIIAERKSWPILYHLSALRENIVDFLPIQKTEKVLEVGSGCEAITGALARQCDVRGSVQKAEPDQCLPQPGLRECDDPCGQFHGCGTGTSRRL